MGEFPLGPRIVTLFVEPKSKDGHYHAHGSQVIVGIGRAQWADTLAILIHEMTEFAFMDMRGRFSPAPDYSESADEYLFIANHPAFAEICARVAWAMADSTPKVHRLWRKYRKTK